MTMKDSVFWRAIACLLTLAALLYAAPRFARAPRVHASVANGVTVVAASEQSTHRLYLVDQDRNVILVYGPTSRNGASFELLASRYYTWDAEATVGNAFKYSARGHELAKMKVWARKRKNMP